MKTTVVLLSLLAAGAFGQVVPTTPTKFGKRDVGAGASTSTTISNGGSSSAGVSQLRPEATVRTTTYVALSPSRQWTSNDGKPLIAKLIGFEDIVTEVLKSDTTALNAKPVMPPGKPTILRDGKVRLLASDKAYEVPLDRLSAADQEFVNNIKRTLDAMK